MGTTRHQLRQLPTAEVEENRAADGGSQRLTGLIVENTYSIDETAFGEGSMACGQTALRIDGQRKPDIEAVDLTSRMHTLNDVLEVTTKPIVFDGDTGGKPEHFVFTCEDAGAYGDFSCYH